MRHDELGAASETGTRYRHRYLPGYGGAVRIIAHTEDPKVIEKILTHLARKAAELESQGGCCLRRADCLTEQDRGDDIAGQWVTIRSGDRPGIYKSKEFVT